MNRDYHAYATDNNGSIKEESKVIKMVFIQISLITPHQILIQMVTLNFLFNLGLIAILFH